MFKLKPNCPMENIVNSNVAVSKNKWTSKSKSVPTLFSFLSIFLSNEERKNHFVRKWAVSTITQIYTAQTGATVFLKLHFHYLKVLKVLKVAYS